MAGAHAASCRKSRHRRTGRTEPPVALRRGRGLPPEPIAPWSGLRRARPGAAKSGADRHLDAAVAARLDRSGETRIGGNSPAHARNATPMANPPSPGTTRMPARSSSTAPRLRGHAPRRPARRRDPRRRSCRMSCPGVTTGELDDSSTASSLDARRASRRPLGYRGYPKTLLHLDQPRRLPRHPGRQGAQGRRHRQHRRHRRSLDGWHGDTSRMYLGRRRAA